MRPQYHLDLEVLGVRSTGAGATLALPVLARLMSVLHGVFRANPGLYAIALPRMRKGADYHPGHVVRVFAEKRDHLLSASTALMGNERIAGYIALLGPRAIPADFAGPWREYRRYRIPNRRSIFTDARQRRLREGDLLPYIKLGSKSTGQMFSLRIDCIDAPYGSGDCQPDSFGLSISSHPFALPVLR